MTILTKIVERKLLSLNGEENIEMTFDTQSPAYAEHYASDSAACAVVDDEFVIDQEQQYRASAYALIAALLRAAPDQSMLDRLTDPYPAGK